MTIDNLRMDHCIADLRDFTDANGIALVFAAFEGAIRPDAMHR